MANFKVGQRVKIIGHWPSEPLWHGKEGVITRPAMFFTGQWAVTITSGQQGLFLCSELAPLTDPKADEFIEALKKLAREPAPVRLVLNMIKTP